MLSRPTTEQILNDCAKELMESVLPTVSDDTAIVRIVMIETVLRSAAVRAAHEIAWMTDETAAMEAYARDAGVSVAEDGPRESRHLDDVVEIYDRAGRALSAALEAAVERNDADLIARGEALLAHRADMETETMAGWSPTGR